MERYKYLGALGKGLCDALYYAKKGDMVLVSGLQPGDYVQLREEVGRFFPGRIKVRKTLLTFLGFGSECILTKVA